MRKESKGLHTHHSLPSITNSFIKNSGKPATDEMGEILNMDTVAMQNHHKEAGKQAVK